MPDVNQICQTLVQWWLRWGFENYCLLSGWMTAQSCCWSHCNSFCQLKSRGGLTCHISLSIISTSSLICLVFFPLLWLTSCHGSVSGYLMDYWWLCKARRDSSASARVPRVPFAAKAIGPSAALSHAANYFQVCGGKRRWSALPLTPQSMWLLK